MDRLVPRHTELFVNGPHESISYIWQVFGCRHTLEPTDNDFEPPSIPALTPKGFVRWESIQILLAPEEHVPFIIHAVKNWHLTNPDTGEPFPEDISASSFPSEPDPEISVWIEACSEKLKKEATPRQSPRSAFPSAADRVHAGFSHVPAGSARSAATDYFSHRNVPFAHVSPGHATGRYSRGAGLRVSPERMDSRGTRHNGLSPQEDRARRRSFSDYPSPHDPYSPVHLNPTRPTMAARRHSHPRRVSTEDEESDDDAASPRPTGRSSGHYGPSLRPAARFTHVAMSSSGTPGGTPPVPNVSPSVQIPTMRTEGGGVKLRPDGRLSPATGSRKKSAAGFEEAKGWAKEKLSGIFSASSPAERPRKSPGSSSGTVAGAGGAGAGASRDSLPARLGRSRSYDDGESASDSDYERERRRRKRARERERRERDAAAYERDQRERAAGELRRSREWGEEGGGGGGGGGDGPRPRSSRKDREKEARYLRRPDNSRRTSSHADVDRVDRERQRYDDLRDIRERYVDERRRRGGTLDERAARERTASPGIKGVGGRRYPAEPPWTQETSP